MEIENEERAVEDHSVDALTLYRSISCYYSIRRVEKVIDSERERLNNRCHLIKSVTPSKNIEDIECVG